MADTGPLMAGVRRVLSAHCKADSTSAADQAATLDMLTQLDKFTEKDLLDGSELLENAALLLAYLQGKLKQKETATPKPSAYLCAPMAGIKLARAALMTSPSSHSVAQPCRPCNVREWVDARPGSGAGSTLLQSLLNHLKNADVLYDMTKVPRMRPYSDVPHRNTFSTEGPLSSALDTSMLDPIQHLSQGLPLPFAPGCAWHMLPGRTIMQQGIWGQSGLPVGLLVSDATAPGGPLLTAAASITPQPATLAAAPAAAAAASSISPQQAALAAAPEAAATASSSSPQQAALAAAAAAAASSSSTPQQQRGPAQEAAEAGPSSSGMPQGAAQVQPVHRRRRVSVVRTNLQAMLQGDQRRQQRQSPQHLNVFLDFALSAERNPSRTAGMASPAAGMPSETAGMPSPAATVRSQTAGKQGATVGLKRSAEEAGNQLNTPKLRFLAVLEAKAVRVLAEEVPAPTGEPAPAALAAAPAASVEAAATAVPQLEQQQPEQHQAAARPAAASSAAVQPATSAGSAATAVPAQQQEQQPAAHAPPGPEQVVEYPDEDGGPLIRLKPRDLLRGWREQDRVATKVIIQAYTYMMVWGLCYGAVSCYIFTWLLHCPPHDRGTLYVSPCFSCSTVASQTQVPAVGAMGWLTHEALEHAAQAVDGPLPQPAPEPGAEDPAGSPPDDGEQPGSGDEYSLSDEGTSTSGDEDSSGDQGAAGKQQVVLEQPPYMYSTLLMMLMYAAGYRKCVRKFLIRFHSRCSSTLLYTYCIVLSTFHGLALTCRPLNGPRNPGLMAHCTAAPTALAPAIALEGI